MKVKRLAAIALAAVITAGAVPVSAAPAGSVTESSSEEGFVNNAGIKPVYRVYNPHSGEHFYTASAGEKNHLASIGWRDEGIAWYEPEDNMTNPVKGTTGDPIYRLYNPNSGDHHYTTNYKEANSLYRAGWSYDEAEIISGHPGGFYDSQYYNFIPVYRQYNPHAKTGAHNFTTSTSERNHLVKLGWRDEGVAWYAVTKKRLSDFTAKDLFINGDCPNIPDTMAEKAYGQLVLKAYPEIFQPFADQISRCTTDLGKMIAVSEFIHDQGYIYQVSAGDHIRHFQDNLNFILGKQPYAQCIDVSFKTAVLCLIAGLPVETVQSNHADHAWNQVKLNGKWYQFDNVGLNYGFTTWQNGNRDAYYMSDAHVGIGAAQTGQTKAVSGIYPIPNDSVTAAGADDARIMIDVNKKQVITINARGQKNTYSFESLGYRD